ncbi:hypothetical protein KL86DPRO_40162 [uncultured delta proteobacterium]|uniref:Uncharacterized protein n=1 Tax=uncultured delta proteobacterium TaxID=34034 RepID=A0A212KB31_9DELT|nr:hypothetical protein KL86DPRO_40162 [uncultured delta proteobacterium]
MEYADGALPYDSRVTEMQSNEFCNVSTCPDEGAVGFSGLLFHRAFIGFADPVCLGRFCNLRARGRFSAGIKSALFP